MKHYFLHVFFTISFLWVISNLWAYNNTYAIIIGVSDYANPDINDLTFCTNDAQLFCDFLKSPAGDNVPVQNIRLLKNTNATKSNIVYYAKELFSKAGPDDRVIFFFSGHGCSGYLLPYDSRDNGDNWLSYEEIKTLFKIAKAKTKLMYADACYAGNFRNSLPKNKQKYSSANLKKSDIAIMLSCGINEYSMEDAYLKQGVFSYYLIKGLRGEADRDNNKTITIQELFYYVYRNTDQFAKNAKRSQKPVLIGNFDLRLIVGKR